MHRELRLIAMALLVLAAGCSRTAPKVPRVPIVSIQVDPAEPSLAVGTELLVTAQGIKADGTTDDLADCEWSVSHEGLVAIEAELGTAWLTGLKVGNTRLIVRARGVVAEVPLQVTGAIPRKLQVSPSELSVALNGVGQLTATATLSDGSTEDVTSLAKWTSADGGVATVGDEGEAKGRVTGVAQGETEVRAALDDLEAVALVKVSGATLVRLDIVPPTVTLPLHTAIPVSAVALFSDSSTADVTAQAVWSSTNEQVARVTAGLIEAVGPGEAVVNAAYGGMTARAPVAVTTAQLRAVEIAPAEVQIAKGTSAALKATAIFADDTRQDITYQARWTSSAPAIASVSETAKGVVKGEAPGVAMVTAELLGVTGTAEVTVTDALLTAIAVTPTTLTLAKGSTGAFLATGTYSDQSTQDITSLVLWSSSDETVATVSNAPTTKGQALAKNPGIATLTAALDGLIASATLTVTAAQIDVITIEPAAVVLAKGTETLLVATATYTDGSTLVVTEQAAWSSSANDIASVTTTGSPRGLLRAVAPGQATITAALGGKTGTAQVTVTPATLTHLTIAPLDPSLPKGTELSMRATGTYSDGTVQDVTTLATWSVTDATIASVSNASGSNGVVTARSPGSTTLRATLQGKTASTTLTVTPATLVGFRVAPTSVILEYQGSQQIVATATYSDGTVVDVTATTDWTSADPSIASVSTTGNARGLVRAGRAGQTVVTASFGGKSATVDVTVHAPRLTSVEIRPGSISLPAGTEGQLNAFATYADDSVRDVTAIAAWTASAGNVVVGNGATGGHITARSTGSATITATLDGASATATVTVTPPLAESLTISPTTATIPAGERQAFTVRAFFSDGSSLDVTEHTAFTSADTAIVGLADNEAIGIAQGGPVTLTARYNGLTATARVTVTAPTLTSITLSPNGLVLTKGESGQLRAIGNYSDGSSREVTSDAAWSSSSLAICTVNLGLVQAIGPGTATVTATLLGKAASADVLVEAPTLQRIAIVPPNAVLRPNLIYPFRSYALYSDNTAREITTASVWTSDNPSIAEPINYYGYWGVWAKGVGTAEVRSSYDWQTGTTMVQVFNSTLTGVEVSPAQARLPVGVAVKLGGVFSYTDGWAVEIQNPDWSSENSSIARVDTNGVVTGLSRGTTNISMYAYDSWGMSYDASARIEVTSATIQRIELDVPSRMVVGLAARVKAVGVFSDGSHIDLGPSPVWSSSNTTLARIVPDTSGAKVTAQAAGSVTIGASFGGVSASVSVTLVDTDLSSLSMSIPQTTLPIGSTSKVKVEGIFADNTRLDLTDSVTFDSSAPDVAQVTNGMFGNALAPYVIAQSAGTATVRASLNGKSTSATITVRGANLSSLALALGENPPSSPLTLAGPGPHQLRAVGTFSDGTSADVTVFCSFSPGKLGPGVVATISNVIAGRVSVISTGSETVTATYAPSFIGQPTVSGSATLIVQ
ncbi:MAG: beta strand repeat-containing protein [Myxococcales bacterium]|jgi:hypothetical protein